MPKANLDNYRMADKEVKARFKQVRDNVAELLNLTRKVVGSKMGVRVQMVDSLGNAGGFVTIGPGTSSVSVKTMASPILAQITDLYNFYRAAKSKPKSSSTNRSAEAFESARERITQQLAVHAPFAVFADAVQPVVQRRIGVRGDGDGRGQEQRNQGGRQERGKAWSIRHI